MRPAGFTNGGNLRTGAGAGHQITFTAPNLVQRRLQPVDLILIVGNEVQDWPTVCRGIGEITDLIRRIARNITAFFITRC